MGALKIIGMNCGTSVDGIDVAELSISSASTDVNISLLSYREFPINRQLQSRIRSLCRPGVQTSLEEVCDLNFEIGEAFAEAILKSGIDLSTVDIVSTHGQTLWHSPIAKGKGKGYEGGERRMSTLQMGESAVISRMTGLTVINDFRVAELACGRMGAPLSGFFEASLLRHPTKLRVCQNLGGMGNATVIPPLNSPLAPGYIAFDTGPGNVLIDAAVRILTGREFDEDGQMAREGASEIDEDYVEDYIKSVEYLSWKPPKTTGRELFSDDMAKKIVDDLKGKGKSSAGIVATITRITAETVVRALEDFVVPTYGAIDELFICGGGAENPVVMDFLVRRFRQAKVAKLSDGGSGLSLPVEAKEAVMFGLLGFLCVFGRSVPVASGEKCTDQNILGKITPGSNFVQLLERSRRSEQRSTLRRIVIQ